MILEAEGIAQKRSLEGFTYQDERGFDVAERVAANEAVGQMSNLGVGLGMMAGVGSTVGQTDGGMMQNTMGALNDTSNTNTSSTCSKCGASLSSSAKFCNECGTPVLADNEIICPSCNTKTVKGKFCSNCSASLIEICSKCSTGIIPGGKFCLECGHKIGGVRP